MNKDFMESCRLKALAKESHKIVYENARKKRPVFSDDQIKYMNESGFWDKIKEQNILILESGKEITKKVCPRCGFKR